MLHVLAERSCRLQPELLWSEELACRSESAQVQLRGVEAEAQRRRASRPLPGSRLTIAAAPRLARAAPVQRP